MLPFSNVSGPAGLAVDRASNVYVYNPGVGADTVYFMRRVDYVIQYLESLGRSVTFYRDVIGLQGGIEGDG